MAGGAGLAPGGSERGAVERGGSGLGGAAPGACAVVVGAPCTSKVSSGLLDCTRTIRRASGAYHTV
jgi:hypothetical protein